MLVCLGPDLAEDIMLRSALSSPEAEARVRRPEFKACVCCWPDQRGSISEGGTASVGKVPWRRGVVGVGAGPRKENPGTWFRRSDFGCAAELDSESELFSN